MGSHLRWQLLFLLLADSYSKLGTAFPIDSRQEEFVPSADDFLVDALMIPGLDQVPEELKNRIPEMYAGHIPLYEGLIKDPAQAEQEEKTGDFPDGFGYFFWKFHDVSGISSESDDTLIFWLNGGPGCSSMDGALVESGPLRVKADGTAYLNQGTWTTRGDMVFIDQPIGTGFSSINAATQSQVGSTVVFDQNLQLVSLHFCQFLINYFRVFPEDLDKKIIFAGESYAGQYIPYIASMILRNNNGKNTELYPTIQENLPFINLKALVIGNGWIDPTTQSLAYLPFVMENNLVDQQDPKFKSLLDIHEDCQKKINSIPPENEDPIFAIPECEKILVEFLKLTKTEEGQGENGKPGCLNAYNYELTDTYPECGMNWPVDVSNVALFFTNETVREALHVNKQWAQENWLECHKDVMDHLTNEGDKPSIELFPELLESGLDIVLFNGDKDLICNNKGILDTIQKLEWGDARGFTDDAKRYEWVFGQFNHTDTYIDSGYVLSERNLTFISVYNASHMVPYDKTGVSRGIMDIAMKNVIVDQLDGRDTIFTSDDLLHSDDSDETGYGNADAGELSESNGKEASKLGVEPYPEEDELTMEQEEAKLEEELEQLEAEVQEEQEKEEEEEAAANEEIQAGLKEELQQELEDTSREMNAEEQQEYSSFRRNMAFFGAVCLILAAAAVYYSSLWRPRISELIRRRYYGLNSSHPAEFSDDHTGEVDFEMGDLDGWGESGEEHEHQEGGDAVTDHGEDFDVI